MSTSIFPRVWEAQTFCRIAYQAFPASTAYYLSQITGIPKRTVENHLRGENRPGADHVIAYLSAGQFGQMLQEVLIPKQSGGSTAGAPKDTSLADRQSAQTVSTSDLGKWRACVNASFTSVTNTG